MFVLRFSVVRSVGMFRPLLGMELSRETLLSTLGFPTPCVKSDLKFSGMRYMSGNEVQCMGSLYYF